MKKIVVIIFIQLGIVSYLIAQTIIPSLRAVKWSDAGYTGTIPSYATTVDVVDFGLVNDGTTVNDVAFQTALNSLNGKPGIIYFPAGTYLFNSSITLPDSIIIKGESSGSVLLKFDLGGASANLFNIHGTISTTTSMLSEDVLLNATEIILDNVDGISAGDYIKLFQDDEQLVESSWAINSVAQVVKIKEIIGTKLVVETPLRRTYLTSDNARVVKLDPVTGVGFECFSIERLDETVAQTSNFDFDKAVQCWMTGVNSNKCNFAHVALSTSSNILIRGSYFHHGFSYGGGGKAYGVCLQFSSGGCKVENNIFNNLRHSILLQAGPNGNVCSYNYSLNPVRTEIPNDASGDLVLHGNYPFANLFEGNICQTIIVDDSHGANGPYNTFFRNNIQKYGIIISQAESGTQNFVGNEIVNGFYNLAGTENFEYGNNMVGTITPAGTETLNDLSYYLTSKPSFITSDWPTIGTPFPFNQPALPAKDRFNSSEFTNCSTQNVTFLISSEIEEAFLIYPNPTEGIITIEFKGNNNSGFCEVYSSDGSCVGKEVITENKIDLSKYPAGLYLLKTGETASKIIKK